MGADPSCTESAISHHHVTMVTENRQKDFLFVYSHGIEIQPMGRLTPLKGDKDGVQRVS